VLPYHDDDVNAAAWFRQIELRWPATGEQRKTLPLFPDEDGRPFSDAAFAALIMAVLREILGETRARLMSPHSWRVWLASSLRMCGASDARIQALGRWLNPASVKLYARMTTQEYGEWVDKLMSVRRIDTARTTSLPIMDAADAIAAWGDQLHVEGDKQLDRWEEPEKPQEPDPPPVPPGTRIAIYWTDMDEWYAGTYTSSRIEPADGGGTQRSSRIVYDKTGLWTNATDRSMVYWHNLSDEIWKLADDQEEGPPTIHRKRPSLPPVTPLKGQKRRKQP
jgi:hypothetical protein